MDELLVEFCRTGTLGPLAVGMSPADVVEGIGEPRRIKNGQGDDCFQFYRYYPLELTRNSPLELTMRCFIREARIRHGAGRDLALSSIHINLGGGEPLVLPDAIAREPIAAAPLRLADAHHLLEDRGIEMIRNHDQVLKRSSGDADIRLVSDDDGILVEISAGWRPRPGGWFYSEENEAGIWVAGPPESASTM